MKNLLVGTFIVFLANVSQAQVIQSPAEKEIMVIIDSLQTALNENHVDCKLRLQPLRNFARLIVNQSFKIKGSCVDKDDTKFYGVIKFKQGQNSIIIKKLQVTIENLEISDSQ